MAYTKPSGVNSLWAVSGDKTPVPPAKVSAGWVAEKPSFQYFNQILYNLGLYDAYNNERGIPEWDDETEYQATKSYVVGSDGNVYKCIITNDDVDPTIDDGTNWLQVWNNQGVAKWNLSTAYTESAIVRHTDGESYICHTPQAAGTLPTDHSAFINLKFFGAYAYAVSQLAGGDASLVGFIYIGQTVDSYDYLVYTGDGRIYVRGAVTGTITGAFDPVAGTASGLSGALTKRSIGTAASADLTASATATSGVLQAGDGGINSNITSLTTANGGWLTRYLGNPNSLPREVLRDSTSGPDSGYYYPQIFAYNQTAGETKTFQAWPIANTATPKWATMDVTGALSAWYTMFSSFETASALADYNTLTPTNKKPVTPAGLKTALNAVGVAPMFAARTWINFDGTGVISIRDSGNVLSISDVGAGLYDVTLIEGVDINSSLWTNGNVSSGGANSQVVKANMTSPTTIRVRCVTAANTDIDLEYVMVGVIG